MKLNEEQKRLVEDIHNIIYSVLNRHGWSVNEYYDIAAIGLCTAAIKFDPSKGYKFSTYAYKAIKNSVLMEIRKSKALMRECNNMVSLDAMIQGESGSESGLITYNDVVYSKNDQIEDSVGSSAIKESVKRLNQKQLKIVCLKADGYTQREIADMLGVSRQSICRTLKKVRTKFSEFT